ncbi:sugar transferase [Carnobacterium divergens]|uniref:sugar transferase n=1 Tax=Carnobacterium divergens TaxID=2748 RepID=UPI0010735E6C|nr:sugar transferase [Carnobacterium divergens]TFI93718.1 lipid carrier--UDP-N-acetylgalactosaminyltransferase [Carnobacterium divergens]
MYRSYVKRLIDFACSLLLLIILCPVILFTSLFVAFFLGTPIIFKQKRPGLDEKIFTIYKFRTMSDKKDSDGELLSDEIRLGKFGNYLRKLSLDELPQLFNVLKGDMSFIGPRPLLVEYLQLYSDTQKKRHRVRPGITGWAQVNGRNAITWEKKFDLDVYYAANYSFLMDLKIVFLTFYKIAKRADIASENHVTITKFTGSKDCE